MRFIVTMIMAVTVLFSTRAAVATTARVVPLAPEMSAMMRANNVTTLANLITFKRLRRVDLQRVNFAYVNVRGKGHSWGVLGLWLMLLRVIGL